MNQNKHAGKETIAFLFLLTLLTSCFVLVILCSIQDGTKESAYATGHDPTPTPTPTSGTNPPMSAIGQRLGNVHAKAIAWQESNWRQFGSDNQPLMGTSGDTGMMQVVESVWSNWLSTSGNSPSGYTVAPWSDMK